MGLTGTARHHKEHQRRDTSSAALGLQESLVLGQDPAALLLSSMFFQVVLFLLLSLLGPLHLIAAQLLIPFKLEEVELDLDLPQFRAYQAYKEESFLNYAIQAWNWGRQFTVSDESITAGAIPIKSFALQRTCGDASLAGGTFEATYFAGRPLLGFANNNKIFFCRLQYFLNMVMLNAFNRLSASLYKSTFNETYLIAAKSTANFVRSQLYMGQGLIASTISGSAKDQCVLDRRAQGYNNGIAIQGISLFNAVTSSTEDNALIKDLIVGSSSKTEWNSGNGILTSTTTDSSGLYILNGMMQVYDSATDIDLRNYISSYVSTQYNAVIDNAAGSGDIYASSWAGPAAQVFYGPAQTPAISTLLAGIQLPTEHNLDTQTTTLSSSLSSIGTFSSFTTSMPSVQRTPSQLSTLTRSGSPLSHTFSPSLTSDTLPSASSAKPSTSEGATGLIVGGVLGGLGFVGIVAASIFLVRRWRHSKRLAVTRLVTVYPLAPWHRTSRGGKTNPVSPGVASQETFFSRQEIYRKRNTRTEEDHTSEEPPDYESHWSGQR
ncbi:hypothetical protein VNI00_012180 [Paramarasmius palmivorus]|uniref:Uncharacterized protein n=1 Tax=Paramarasmius palmivorus TaxID=297713 RepID=A0AAW0C8K8_9AGAR